jgi:hypothetical protein
MEVFLPSQCLSIAGSLGQGFGYSLQNQYGRIVGKRNSRGFVPANGHYQFILACAKLAMMGLHIKDISVSREEMIDATIEASCELREDPYTLLFFHVRQDTDTEVYHAKDVLFLHKLYAV